METFLVGLGLTFVNSCLDHSSTGSNVLRREEKKVTFILKSLVESWIVSFPLRLSVTPTGYPLVTKATPVGSPFQVLALTQGVRHVQVSSWRKLICLMVSVEHWSKHVVYQCLHDPTGYGDSPWETRKHNCSPLVQSSGTCKMKTRSGTKGTWSHLHVDHHWCQIFNFSTAVQTNEIPDYLIIFSRSEWRLVFKKSVLPSVNSCGQIIPSVQEWSDEDNHATITHWW